MLLSVFRIDGAVQNECIRDVCCKLFPAPLLDRRRGWTPTFVEGSANEQWQLQREVRRFFDG